MKFGIYYRLKAEITRNYDDNTEMEISLAADVTWNNGKKSGRETKGSYRTGKDRDVVFPFYNGTRQLDSWQAPQVDFFWVNLNTTVNKYKSGSCS